MADFDDGMLVCTEIILKKFRLLIPPGHAIVNV